MNKNNDMNENNNMNENNDINKNDINNLLKRIEATMPKTESLDFLTFFTAPKKEVSPMSCMPL